MEKLNKIILKNEFKADEKVTAQKIANLLVIDNAIDKGFKNQVNNIFNKLIIIDSNAKEIDEHTTIIKLNAELKKILLDTISRAINCNLLDMLELSNSATKSLILKSYCECYKLTYKKYDDTAHYQTWNAKAQPINAKTFVKVFIKHIINQFNLLIVKLDDNLVIMNRTEFDKIKIENNIKMYDNILADIKK